MAIGTFEPGSAPVKAEAPDEKGTTPAEDPGKAAPETPEEPEVAVEEETTEEPGKEPAGRSAKLQKLIQSKGGEDKLADSIYQTYNSLSEFSQRIASLESAIKEAKAAPPLEDDPDLQDLEQETARIQEDRQDLANRQQSILVGLDKAKVEAAELAGEIRRADPDDKPQLLQQKALADAKVQTFIDKFQDLNSKRRDLDKEEMGLKRQARKVQEAAEQRRVQQQQLDVADKQFKARTLSTFIDTATDVASGYGVEPGSEAYEEFVDTMKAKITFYLRSLPDGAPPVDVAAFIKDAGARYAKANGLDKKSNFKKLTEEKLETVKSNGKVQGKAVLNPASHPEPTKGGAGAWRARAQKILG